MEGSLSRYFVGCKLVSSCWVKRPWGKILSLDKREKVDNLKARIGLRSTQVQKLEVLVLCCLVSIMGSVTPVK